MTEVLTLPVNSQVLDLYAICKEQCFFTQKSDNDFVLFLLNSAVQVVSIVKQFTGQVDFTEKAKQKKVSKTIKIERDVDVDCRDCRSATSTVGQNEEMPTLEDIPRSETTMTIEDFVRKGKQSIYTASEDDCSDSETEYKSGSEDSDDNHEYPFSSKEFMLPSLPLVPERTPSSIRSAFKRNNDPSNPKPFSCHICSFTTKYRSNLSKHVINQHSTKSLYCDQCDFITTKKRSLTVHRKRHIRDVIAEPCLNRDSTEDDSNDEEEEEDDVIFKITKDKLIPDQKGKSTPECKAFVCVLCGRDFTGQTVLDRHMLVHQRKPQVDLTSEEPVGLPAPTSVPDKVILTPEIMGCDLCEFVTKGMHWKKNLQRHRNRKHKSCVGVQDLSPRIVEEAHQLNTKVVGDTDLVVTRQKQGIGNLIKAGSILPHSNNSYGTPGSTTPVTPSTVTPTLPSVSTTLPTISTALPSNSTILPSVSTTLPPVSTALPPVSTTLPSVSTTLPSVSTALSSISSSLPSIASSLPSIPSSLPSITSSLPQLALKIKSLQKASLKRLITPHVGLNPPDPLQCPTISQLTNVSLHQQDIPLISPIQNFSQRSPGHDMKQNNPRHDMTQSSPGHDMSMTQSSPGHDFAHSSPGHDITQSSPELDITQDSPGYDVTQDSPELDITESSHGHDITQSSPGYDVTQSSHGHDITQSSPVENMEQLSCSPEKSTELPLENDLLDIESNILTPHNPFTSEGSWGYPSWQENFPKQEMMDHMDHNMFSQDMSSIDSKDENPW